MSLDILNAAQDAMLDALESYIGTSAVLKIRTGAVPGIAAADSGTVLATLNLPSDWMAAASGGSKAKVGTWQDASADATGTAAHFRLYKNDGSTPVIEGTVTVTGGGGDITLDDVSIDAGQTVTIAAFTLNGGN